MRTLGVVQAALLGITICACSAPQNTPSSGPTVVPATERPTSVSGGPAACPATLAFQRPPDQIIDWARQGASPPVSHDEAVEHAKRSNWVGADGIWIALPTDGRVTWGTTTTGSKFPVWMTASGVATATAHRIDGSTPPGVIARFNGANTKGEGPGFNSSSITFPTNGCWEVTYRVGDGTLRFVVEVAIS